MPASMPASARRLGIIVYLILDGLGVNIPKSLSRFGALATRYVNKFPSFREHGRMQLVIFIDEFDAFLEVDKETELGVPAAIAGSGR